jgi:uncharacterized integral membrane protein
MAKFILGVIIGIIVIVFLVQNVEIVEIKFIAWSFSISRALMILIVFIAGSGFGYVIKSIGYRKKNLA